MYTCDMTPSYVRHDSFICVTCLASRVCATSFTISDTIRVGVCVSVCVCVRCTYTTVCVCVCVCACESSNYRYSSVNVLAA